MNSSKTKPSTHLIRLDASPYQVPSFFDKERELAQELGLGYLRLSESSYEEADSYILISNTHTQTDKIPQEVLRKTILWLHPNSGYDNFSADWVKQQDFPIVLGNSIRHGAVVEYTLSHLFHFHGFHPHQASWSKERKWQRRLLRDARVLIIGSGLIGTTMAQSLNPLVSDISVFDPFKYPNHPPLEGASAPK